MIFYFESSSHRDVATKNIPLVEQYSMIQSPKKLNASFFGFFPSIHQFAAVENQVKIVISDDCYALMKFMEPLMQGNTNRHFSNCMCAKWFRLREETGVRCKISVQKNT